MLLLTATTDKIQLISGQAVTLDVHCSYMDASNAVPPVVQGDTMGRTNTAISTATTTDIIAAPGSGDVRNVKTIHVRNKGTSSCDVTIQFNQNATLYELYKVTLRPNDHLEYVEGIGFFVSAGSGAVTNKSTSAQSSTFGSDTYLTGSFVTFPVAPQVGTTYILTFDMTKTAASTSASIITIRTGTAGTTSDTSRCQFTLSAGTAATDTGVFTVTCLFRTVGSGTNAVLQGRLNLDSQPTTGITSLIHGAVVTSSGFDSTTASLGIGCSYNGGTSFSGTVQLVTAELTGY